ncbi:MAG: DUF3611 family protein [Thiohalocapsa sp.]|jgi:hypothetical protein|uniref:DUF3611 family protein n=1 Tax=Thiohalocapsa sp. TaxID=2497641 RepID=UPI0025E80CB5|nr:DUF3611 family protein [Thiohalocapsa sp.]MCG6941387.1 DUF3611 family protein [Thiohalocapsa sp.]
MAVAPWPPKDPDQLGATFSKLGWTGFAIQLVLLAVPLALAVYVIFGFSPQSAARKGIDLSNYLSYGGMIVTIFTAFWFFRYPALGHRIAAGDARLSGGGVVKTVWIGIWASCLGILFSMLLLFGAAGRLLFVMLANPQTGLMISPNIGGNPSQSISALDGISLLTLLIMLTAELVVLGLSLWLLYRTVTPASEVATAKLAAQA